MDHTDLIRTAADPGLLKQYGYALIDLLAADLRQAVSDDYHTLHQEAPEDQLRYWEEDFAGGQEADPLALFRKVLDRSVKIRSRGYAGHQVCPPHLMTVLTSALMAYLNNGMAVYEMGMSGNAMERIVLKDLAARFGLPEGAAGFITSGGSLGNLTALLTARAHYLSRNPGTNYRDLAVMVSSEAHYSIERALLVMGMDREQLIKVPVKPDFTMDVAALPGLYGSSRVEGKAVFCLIGCACSTATGAYDDLEALGDFTTAHGIWFHVDAAHGGPALFSPRYAHLLAGSGRADSLIIDFHKMMMVPSPSTAVLYRSAGAANLTFMQDARYLWEDQDSDEWYNSGKRTFECTKPMTVLHIYFLLRLYGARLFGEQVDYLYGLAEKLAGLLGKDRRFGLLNRPQANIVCFRVLSPPQDPDVLNREVLKKLAADGRFYIVSTTVGGRFYFRVSLMNPQTTPADLEELLATIADLAGAGS